MKRIPPHTDPDADVLLGLRAGDERALKELMSRHLSRIQGTAFRILGDAAMAEDVAQTVFLKTWEVAPVWKTGKAKLLTWMLRLATNQCLDILKKKSPVYTDEVPDVSDGDAGALAGLIAGEARVKLDRAMAQLPDRQKAALILSYYEDVSQKEGAHILGVSVSAFESLLVRAKRSLKDVIEASSIKGDNVVGLRDYIA